MAAYTQNTILKFLEKAIPQMQSSEDAETCLMKVAKENNFTPAAFERTCHMFNSLKLNDLYNKSEMEKRGSYTATLNVPEIVEKYTDYTKDVDFKSLGKTQFIDDMSSIGFADLLNMNEGDSIALKTASDNSVSDLSELEYLRDKEAEDAVLKDALTDKVKYKYLKTAKEVDDHIREVDDAERLESLRQQLIIQETRNKERIEKKFASAFGNAKFCNYDFGQIESDALLSCDSKQEQDDLFNACDTLVASVGYSSKFASSKMQGTRNKIASFKKHLINKSNVELINGLKEYNKSLKKIAFCKEDANFLKEAGVETLDLNQKINKSENGNDQDDGPGIEIVRVGQPETREKNISGNIKMQKATNMLSDFASSVVPTTVAGTTAAFKNVNKELKNTTSVFNSKQQAIDDEIYKVEAEGTLNELLYIDPVLSKIEGQDLKDLLDVYSSVVAQEPRLAVNKAALKSILRQAVSIGGAIDLGTLDSLSKIRESAIKADADLIDVLKNKYTR